MSAPKKFYILLFPKGHLIIMATLGESLSTATQSVSSISDALMQMAYSVIGYLPFIIGAIIILFIGWVPGGHHHGPAGFLLLHHSHARTLPAAP